MSAYSTQQLTSAAYPTLGRYQYVVPAGIYSMTVYLWGAGGGGGGSASFNGGQTGGAGACGSAAIIPIVVAPGDLLDISIGQSGQAGVSAQADLKTWANGDINGTAVAGGLGGTSRVDGTDYFSGGNGGAAGAYTPSASGGGGGGATVLSITPAGSVTSTTLAIIAGGGGGGGGSKNFGLYAFNDNSSGASGTGNYTGVNGQSAVGSKAPTGGGGGGGGGGFAGGLGGHCGKSDNTYIGGGGIAGQSGISYINRTYCPQAVLQPGSLQTPATVPSVNLGNYYFPTPFAGGGYADAPGGNGLALFELGTNPYPWVKDSGGVWHKVTNAYTKVGSQWHKIINTYYKNPDDKTWHTVNSGLTTWNPVLQNAGYGLSGTRTGPTYG
jgi:hypothetical protein